MTSWHFSTWVFGNWALPCRRNRTTHKILFCYFWIAWLLPWREREPLLPSFGTSLERVVMCLALYNASWFNTFNGIHRRGLCSKWHPIPLNALRLTRDYIGQRVPLERSLLYQETSLTQFCLDDPNCLNKWNTQYTSKSGLLCTWLK